MSGSDPVCPERLDPDPDPVCPERLDPDPDPVNIRPDPKPWYSLRQHGPASPYLLDLVFNILKSSPITRSISIVVTISMVL